MKEKLLILSLFICVLPLCAYESPDWDTIKFVPDQVAKRILFVDQDNRSAGFLIAANNGKIYDPSLLKIKKENGYVIVDTRALHAKDPKAVVFFKFRNLAPEDIVPGEKAYREIDVTCEPKGRRANFILEGGRRSDGKVLHTFLRGMIMINNTKKPRLEQVFPNYEYTGLQPVIQLLSAGVYKIGKVTFGLLNTN